MACFFLKKKLKCMLRLPIVICCEYAYFLLRRYGSFAAKILKFCCEDIRILKFSTQI